MNTPNTGDTTIRLQAGSYRGVSAGLKYIVAGAALAAKGDAPKCCNITIRLQAGSYDRRF